MKGIIYWVLRRAGAVLAVSACLVGFPGAAWAVLPAGVSLERIYTPADGLSHASILAVSVATDNVFIGTERNLSVLKKDGTFTVWGPANSPLKLQRVPAVIVRGNGEVWAACRSPVAGGGTYKWDGLQWSVFEEIKDDMQSNYVSCFAVDEKGVVWIGTDDQGANYYVWESNPYRKFGYLASKKGLLDNRITSMSTRPGEVWIGTMTGVSVYRGRDGEKYLFTNYTRADGLPAEHVTAVSASPDRVLAGTTKGLALFEGGSWKLLDASAGLADPWVTAVLIDGADAWVGTKKGLQLLRGGRFEPPVDYRDGLPSAHIQCLALARDADGAARLYVGTDRGLVVLKRQR
ncbi:hypothetical protein KBA41_11805 [Candidatus Ozemobacteraceae bacterium]|nr:hypothetical protein [Candidatus Ozemobacteraceae bacterium]